MIGRMPVSVLSRRRVPLCCGRALLTIVIAGLGLARPWPAGAQETTPGALPPQPSIRPFELLLEQQTALGLTTEQLNSLDRIRERLTRANAPLVTRMLALRRQWQRGSRRELQDVTPQEAKRLEQIRAAAESVRSRIQRNNQTAMRAANRLLTAEQRSKLRTILRERRGQGAGPESPGLDSDAPEHN
jgi:hypothetical protein